MESVVITGGGTGLGRELGILFAKKGFSIILLGRSKHTLEKTASLIHEQGGKAKFYTVDITNIKDVQNVVSDLQSEPLHTVINNAGIGHFGPLLELSESETYEMLNVNVIGTINVTKAFLPLLMQSPSYLINIISTAGLRGKKNESVYCASKFAVRGFTDSLKMEYAETNVNVIGAFMGGMNTPFWDESDHVSDKSRLRSPTEIAEIIVNSYEQREDIIIESQK